ncbi:MAG TPA: hypothetical protein VMV50_00340, partial [Candidatus Paceibacterota bacterium]|nr:hypothetical protein [Candidatus Paceibacterota bacterium]
MGSLRGHRRNRASAPFERIGVAMTRAAAVLFLCLALSAPLVAAPRTVHAQYLVLDASNLIKNTLTSVMTSAISGSTNALWVKEYILDPIAWTLAQQTLQSMTGSVVNFIN